MPYAHTTKKTWAQIKAALKNELELWGAETFSLTSGTAAPEGVEQVKTNPAKIMQTPEEATVTLVVNWPKRKDRAPLTIRYNRQARAVDNAAVILLCVHDLRLNEVRGLDAVMREAYLQLPAGDAERVKKRDPYEVLGVTRETSLLVVEAAYKALINAAHPDKGGTTEQAAEINDAYAFVKAQARE